VISALVTTLFAMLSGPTEPAEPQMSVWTEELTVCEAPAPKPPPRALCVDADGVVDRACLSESNGGLPVPGPRSVKRSVEMFAIVLPPDAPWRSGTLEALDDTLGAHDGRLRRIDRPPRA
jgi:hypothetical protein